MVRFIHGADLHLDSPFIGLKSLPDFLWEEVYQSTFQALTAIVDLAIEKQVDFLILAGDIYDSDDRSVKAQAFLRGELSRLELAEIPVFICHGNHDYIENTGLHLEMPSNVIIFDEAVETHWVTTKAGERVAITSFSYNQRWIRQRMIQDYPQRLIEADYQIGILHGSVEGLESEHGVYAPFSIAELKAKKYDYWALGHIHKRQILNEEPLVIYSGNTQGRNRKETGAKGCELVELSLTGAIHEFEPVAAIVWQEHSLSLKGLKNLGEIYQVIQAYLTELKAAANFKFIALILTDTTDVSISVRKKIQTGELLEALQQITKNDVPIIWVYQLELEKAQAKNTELSFLTEEWQKALAVIQQEVQFNEATNFLFEQDHVEEQLDSRDTAYRQKIMQLAQEKIMEQLGIEGSELDEN